MAHRYSFPADVVLVCILVPSFSALTPKSIVLESSRRFFPNASAAASLFALDRFSGIGMLLFDGAQLIRDRTRLEDSRLRSEPRWRRGRLCGYTPFYRSHEK